MSATCSSRDIPQACHRLLRAEEDTTIVLEHSRPGLCGATYSIQTHHQKRTAVPEAIRREYKSREPVRAPCQSGTAMESGISVRGVALRDGGSIFRVCRFIRCLSRLMLVYRFIRLSWLHACGLSRRSKPSHLRRLRLFHLNHLNASAVAGDRSVQSSTHSGSRRGVRDGFPELTLDLWWHIPDEPAIPAYVS